MNVTENIAKKKLCPMAHAFLADGAYQPKCVGSECMLWQWDEPLFEGPDSYISDPPPTGHCGLIKGEPA